MADRDGLVSAFQTEMERCVAEDVGPKREAASTYARTHFLWSEKAGLTRNLYQSLLEGTPLGRPYG